VVVFYSGHGVPGLKDKRGYILPVDADAETPEINGYPVDTLLANLGKLKTKSMTVFLDACFSGDSQGGRLVRSTSAITISPKLPNSSTMMTVISAAQGDQVASWDLKARHGMFTKHLLDALRGEADKPEHGNSDKKVSLGEVRDYLDDRLTRAARREFGRHQNAWARGDNGTVLAKVIPTSQIVSVATVPRTKVITTAPILPTQDLSPHKYKPGDTFKDCDDCPEMVVIPSGTFQMGNRQPNWPRPNGTPVHLVTIAYKLAVGKVEVTQRQWRSLMPSNPSKFKEDENPVEMLSWDDAQQYIRALNSSLGLAERTDRYRLLSEAEWEYAARAGTTTKYFFGNKAKSDFIRMKGHGPTKVGSYPPNPFGLYDMHGNVYEWVQDCWNDSYESAPKDGSPQTYGKCKTRVMRGGSWANYLRHMTSSYRNWIAAERDDYIGFRVARALAQ
jgi:formylglycine-generating enzyme required for sulfatase activity